MQSMHTLRYRTGTLLVYAVPYGTVLYGIVSGRMDGGDGLATPLTGLAMDAHDRTRLD